jgi:hypothetical protein
MASRFQLTPYAAELAGIANYPQLTHINGIPALSYDPTTDESAIWSFRLPVGWTGTPAIRVDCMMASAVTGNIGLKAQVMAVTPGDALDLDTATSYDTVNTVSGVTVPATAGYLFTASVTLTNFDSGVAGDWVRLMLTRDAAGDTATGDLYVLSVMVEDGA